MISTVIRSPCYSRLKLAYPSKLITKTAIIRTHMIPCKVQCQSGSSPFWVQRACSECRSPGGSWHTNAYSRQPSRGGLSLTDQATPCCLLHGHASTAADECSHPPPAQRRYSHTCQNTSEPSGGGSASDPP